MVKTWKTVRAFISSTFYPGRTLITATRLWLFDRSRWDANLTALCSWCGGRFNADPFFDATSPGFSRGLSVLGIRTS